MQMCIRDRVNTIMQMQIYVDNEGEAFDVTYWRPKWEVGNKATDWAPAPEDIDADINTVKGDIDHISEEELVDIRESITNINQTAEDIQLSV